MNTVQAVQRVIEIDYAFEAQEAVAKILLDYGDQSFHAEPERVRLAALKLAAGDIDALRRAISAAQIDYRDILAWAESPNEMGRFSRKNTLSRKQALDEDKRQWQEWLRTYEILI